MKSLIPFLLLLSAAIWLAVGADWIQTAADAWDAFEGLMACLCGLLLALLFVFFVAGGGQKVRG